MKPCVLVIDDEESICSSVRFALYKEYDVMTACSAREALACIRTGDVDIALLDLRLGESSGLDLLPQIKELDPGAVVLMMTAYGTVDLAVQAMKSGAFNFLLKPLDFEQLLVHVRQAAELARAKEQLLFLKSQMEQDGRYNEIIGKSEGIRAVCKMIDKLKDIDTAVTVTGESGVGKELVARALHFSGRRREERFVVINCAAVPANLLEEEFFGHKRGSFTGAMQDKKGKFEIADGGTLFLDEIGDLPLELQGKMLRVLQDKEFTPLGGTEPRKVDVRVVVATNRDLKGLVGEGRFRPDLYYRIHVMEIRVPPLRERREDIPDLCGLFIKKFSTQQNKSVTHITKPAMESLMRYGYPGNIRQLSNILEYAMIFSTDGKIDLKDLPEEIRGAAHEGAFQQVGEEAAAEYLAGKTIRHIERMAIAATLKKNGGRRDITAAELGISVRGLINKIAEYHLK